MNTRLLLPILMVLFGTFMSCEIEEPLEIERDDIQGLDTQGQVEEFIAFKMNMTDQGFAILEEIPIDLDKLKSFQENEINSRGNPNTITVADFTSGPFGVEGSAVLNPSGIHGSVIQTGPFSYEGDASCLFIWGDGNNRSVNGFTTTSSDGLPFPIGWTIYSAIEDNGEGANAPPDRVNQVFVASSNPDRCAYYASFFAAVFEGFWVDIDSGQIQVKAP